MKDIIVATPEVVNHDKANVYSGILVFHQGNFYGIITETNECDKLPYCIHSKHGVKSLYYKTVKELIENQVPFTYKQL